MASENDGYYWLIVFTFGIVAAILAFAFVVATSPLWIPYSIYRKIRYGKWWFFDFVKEWNCVKDSTQASPPPNPVFTVSTTAVDTVPTRSQVLPNDKKHRHSEDSEPKRD